MIRTFLILLIFQCLGEGFVFMSKMPVPGPVIGMLLLFGFLLLKRGCSQTDTRCARVTQTFIPAVYSGRCWHHGARKNCFG